MLDDGAVVLVAGAVVVVAAVAAPVVGVDVWAPVLAWSSAVTTVPVGLGSVVPAGTNPMVISWLLVKRSVAGLPATVVGFSLDAKAFAQEVTVTTPFLPASLVPFGQVSPFL